MKKNELRIGNLVKLNGEIIKVEQITKKKIGYHKEPRENVMHYARLVDIEPIELTEELMLKIGFKKDKYDWWKYFPDRENAISILMTDNYTTIEYANLFYCPEDVTEVNYGSTLEFPRRIYLHELQNAYYCLTNEELEVEL